MRIFFTIMLLLSMCGMYQQSRADDFGDEDDGYSFNDDGDGDGQYDSIYDVLLDILENGLANFDDGVTHITFDDQGNVESFDNYTMAELEANPDLLPPEVWEYIETLQEYVAQEHAYQESVQDAWENIGNYNYQRIAFLEQHFSQNDFRFLPGPNNSIYVYDLHNPSPGPHDIIYPTDNNIPWDWPGFHYEGGNPTGGNEPTWGQDIDWTFPDYNNMPDEPYNPFDEDWFYWYYGTGGTWGQDPTTPPPPPPPPPHAEDPLELDATFNGVSTYVTPSGTPIKFPPGTKIRLISNVDYDYYPNGALYTFILPDGSKYGAWLSFWTVIGGGLVIPPPKFEGYYKVVGGFLQSNQPFPYNSSYSDQPDPNTGKFKAVRLRLVKNPDGSCKLVREIVEYEQSPGSPATPVHGEVNVNHNIEYEDNIPGTTVSEHPVQCPGSVTPPAGNNWNLTQYVQARGADVAKFLREKLKHKVRIVLYDCNTQQAKYTITSDEGAKPVLPLQQGQVLANYNNGNFNEDFAIKGCLENGKWKYEAKLKPGTVPDSKVAPVQQAVLDAIKRHADEEVKNIKGPGAMNKGETFDAGNGEKFEKDNMDLLEAISAIWDVGTNIYKEGTLPGAIWDRGVRAGGSTNTAIREKYDDYPFNMPSGMGGVTDQLVEEVTGVLQLVEAGYEFVRHPKKTLDGVWNGVKTLDGDKIKQILSGASGHANYVEGGDKAWYQGGRHSVQAAMIIVSGLKTLGQGVKVVKEAGEEVSGFQKFLPNGTTNNNVSDALKNAADNQKVVKNLNDQKLVTKNVVGGEERIVVVNKEGGGVEIYDGKANHNIDGYSDEVLTSADPDDIVDLASDNATNAHYSTQPQKFKDGKDFERRIRDDPQTKVEIGNKTGIDLSNHQKLTQVQLKTSDGNYFVADEVYIKQNITTGKYEVVINETKLSSASPFTGRQDKFLEDLRNGTVDFELRNSKFDNPAFGNIQQGEMFNVKAMVKTQGDGTVNGPASFFKYDPATNSWQ